MILNSSNVLTNLNRLLGEPLSGGKEEHRYNCPFCLTKVGKEDHNHHLYVNVKKGKFNCFRCETSGSLKTLFRLLNINTLVYALTSQERDRPIEVQTPLSPKDQLPLDAVLVDECSPGYAYLTLKRRIPEDVVKSRKFYYSPSKKMIIFPIYKDTTFTELIFWQGRSVNGRYFCNPTGVSKSSFVYGLEYVDTSKKFMFITEGVVSSLNVPNGVALLGKELSKDQVDLLVSFIKKHDIRDVYLGIDNDFFYKNYLYCSLLRDKLFLKKVSFKFALLPKGKDWADLPYDIILKMMPTMKTIQLVPQELFEVMNISISVYNNSFDQLVTTLFGKKVRRLPVLTKDSLTLFRKQ